MILVKKAETKDAVKISRLLAEIVSTTEYYSQIARRGEIEKYSEESIRKIVANKNALVIVAKNKKQIVAFLLGHYERNLFFGDWIGVTAENRRSGIASDLLFYLFRELKGKSVTNMQVHTRLDNDESINMLKKLGFQKIGLLSKNWYGEDSFVWVKSLND